MFRSKKWISCIMSGIIIIVYLFPGTVNAYADSSRNHNVEVTGFSLNVKNVYGYYTFLINLTDLERQAVEDIIYGKNKTKSPRGYEYGILASVLFICENGKYRIDSLLDGKNSFRAGSIKAYNNNKEITSHSKTPYWTIDCDYGHAFSKTRDQYLIKIGQICPYVNDILNAKEIRLKLCYSDGHGTETGISGGKVSYENNFVLHNLVTEKRIDRLSDIDVHDAEYTGKPVIPYVYVANGIGPLKNGTDYMLTCSNNIEVGKASVTIKGIGEYSGSKTLYFNILPKRVYSYTECKASLHAERNGNKMNLEWISHLDMDESFKEEKGDYWQLQYSTDNRETYHNAGTVSAEKRSCTLKVKSNLKYYFRIRYVKVINGKKSYSRWSNQAEEH